MLCNLAGTIRNCHPEETLSRVTPFFSQLGITRVANITGLDDIGIPVTTCMRPNAKHVSVSQGKGINLELAKVSAIMESIEGFHAENPKTPDLNGSYQALKTDFNLLNPSHFIGNVFQKENLKNETLPWIKANDLLTQETVYLPHALICLDSSKKCSSYGFFNVSSNGLAAGNTLSEAISHGLYEVIERHALSCWQQKTKKQREQTRLNLKTISNHINQTLMEKITRKNRWLKIWDLTDELGIPTFHCALLDNNLFRKLQCFTGTGTHSSKSIALSRAITEAAQARLTYISGSRDDIYIDFYQGNCLSESQDATMGIVDYKDINDIDIGTDFDNCLIHLKNRLHSHGFNNIVYVDHTRPDLNIPVVHVFVPECQFNGVRM